MQRIIIAFLLVWALAATSLSAYLLVTPRTQAQAQSPDVAQDTPAEMTAAQMCRQMQEAARPYFSFPGGVEYPECGEFGAEPRQDEDGEWHMNGQATIDRLDGEQGYMYSIWAWPTSDGWDYQVEIFDLD